MVVLRRDVAVILRRLYRHILCRDVVSHVFGIYHHIVEAHLSSRCRCHLHLVRCLYCRHVKRECLYRRLAVCRQCHCSASESHTVHLHLKRHSSLSRYRYSQHSSLLCPCSQRSIDAHRPALPCLCVGSSLLHEVPSSAEQSVFVLLVQRVESFVRVAPLVRNALYVGVVVRCLSLCDEVASVVCIRVSCTVSLVAPFPRDGSPCVEHPFPVFHRRGHRLQVVVFCQISVSQRFGHDVSPVSVDFHSAEVSESGPAYHVLRQSAQSRLLDPHLRPFSRAQHGVSGISSFILSCPR